MLNRILNFSVEHRFLVVLLTIGAAVVGGMSLMKLPIDAVPDITNVQVQINTEYLSLSPVEIEKQVTFPIEWSLAGIPGLDFKKTRSISRDGFSQVTAVFDEGTDIYFARQQVLERLNAARENLPPGAEPQMGPISTGLGEVLMYVVEFEHPDGRGATVAQGQPGWKEDGTYLTPEGEVLRTDVEKAAYLRTVQDWIIGPQLRTVQNVAGVDSIGGYAKQYHVEPDPDLLVSYGLTFHDVIEAIEKNNTASGARFIERHGEQQVVKVDGRIQTITQIEDIAIGMHKGTPVRISDVAKVGIGKELRTGAAGEMGKEVVVGTALMLIGANSRTVAAGVERKLEEINRGLPEDVRARPVLNRMTLVDKTVKTIEKNLTEGAILVIVVLFLMLGNFRAAFLTALAIPLSMLMAAIGMVQFGISGNLMSLGAIDFGIIVDGSVIIVENCLRQLAERQTELGRQLSLKERLAVVKTASSEVRSATAFGEAIIIIVYFPILTLTGVEGKMFTPMAATVIFALAAAFILSLTFIPAMVALLVSGKVKEKEIFLVHWSKLAYAPLLRYAIRMRYVTVLLAVGFFAGSLFVFSTLGQVFAPQLDEGNLAMHGMRIPSVGITQSAMMNSEVEKALGEVPEVAFVFSKTGTAEVAMDPMPPNVSDNFIILRDRSDWPNPDLSKEELIENIQAKLNEVPGNLYEFTQPIEMRFNELISGVRADVAVKVFGDEFETMLPTAQEVLRILQSVDGASDAKMEQVEGLPLMTVQMDRDALARYGLNVEDVQEVVAIAIGGREAGLVFQGDRRFDIIVRLPESIRENIQRLKELPIPLPHRASPESEAMIASIEGFAPPRSAPKVVYLDQVADLVVSEGLNQVSRENGKRRVVVQCNVRGRDIGSFVTEAQERMETDLRIPAGIWLDWGGQFENLQSARKRLTIVVPVCFFLIFILLFSTFNSARYALLVFTAVPLALTGGIISLWLRDMPFSISAAVGFIALSGVAVLNGLVMVKYINQLREEGAALDDAIIRGSLTRMRPVLMTALVASLGFLPMALAHGAGAEVQKPLATVVIGGIVTSTALTLLVLPALYRIWHRREISPEADVPQ